MDVSTVYFPSAVALGALHALEPGHAKTLTAAYLIGTKGTKTDAVLLGLSVALTHSIVVIGLSVGAVWLGREAFTDEAARWLAIVSGAIVVVLGLWLLRKRIRVMRRAAQFIGHSHDHSHSHAPDPQPVKGRLTSGIVEIIGTPAGERLRLILDVAISGLSARVEIMREGGRTEVHVLAPENPSNLIWLSDSPPAEPHEFKAKVILSAGAETEALRFEVKEPNHQDHHNHDNMSDDEHARAHAATLPSYVAQGERPTPWQVMAFGGAGGMIPCPAAVTVMLLSLSVAKTANGLLLVAGFSIGLAITLVGVGLAVVMGLSKLAGTGRLSWLSKHAPVISASLVILSGAVGLSIAIFKGQ
jgi:nickel/cobalt exporter